MENKKEKTESEIPSDVDQHDSPIKDAIVLVDDAVQIDYKHFTFQDGVTLVCNFIQLLGDFFHFKNAHTGEIVKVNKHQSIVTALNKINFSPECTLEINCIGDDKFKITKK